MAYVWVDDEEQDLHNQKPKVRLIGQDGNASSILARVKQAFKEYSKVDPDFNYYYMYEEYRESAISGNYNHLLQVTMDWCDVY